MLLLWLLNKGKRQPWESMASWKEVLDKPHCKLLLSTAACTSETSALNFIALFPDGVVVLRVVQYFVMELLDSALCDW